MKQTAFLLIIFVVCLFYSLSVFSASSTQNKTIINTNTSSTSKTTPTSVQKSPVQKTVKGVKKELPIIIAIEKKGEKLYVKLNRTPAKVDLYSYKLRLHTFLGRGNTKFNITPYLSKVRKHNITVFAYSTKGTKYQKNFNLSKYRVFSKQKSKTGGKKIIPLIGKGKTKPGLKDIGSPTDSTSRSTIDSDSFIPGGISILTPAYGTTVERGRFITISYRLVRGFDHLPEEIDFKIKQYRSTQVGELLKTVRFGTEDSGADLSAVREVEVQLPFGMRDGWSYIITANSRYPSQSGVSRSFHVSTPENSISVFSPGASDRFPPNMGINIPVRYSFTSGSTPANVTIRIAKDSGSYNMELYSGPPLSTHSLSRPPDTWPTWPDGDYRIVVNTDDGRIGYSEKFSLSPYRFSLIEPNGGDTFHTSYSPWWFRWHAEESIDFVQAVLLKGGREMYRWTPHVNPPDHLLGDEITISPEQPWHPAGTDYKFRIEGYIYGEGDIPVLVASDESERNFEVVDDWEPPLTSYAHCNERNPISIVEPARSSSAISWENNSTYPITWCVHDESVSSVDLSLVKTSTGERWGIRMGVPNRFESIIFPGDRGYNGGSMDYTVPEALASGYYNLHIQSGSGGYENTTYYGLSIRNWLRKGASPIRSTVWAVGETRDIEWESGGLSDETVDIVLRHWDARREYVIAGDVPNTGRFSWRILAEALPEGITRWENVYFIIFIGSHRANSEFFTIAR